jgi:PST family polysaccharide transporter
MSSTTSGVDPIGRAAARGAAWMIATSMGARVVGLFGTLIVTRFLAPEVMGEIATATIISLTTGWVTIWGFGQYAVVKGRGDDALEVTWHATVAYAVVGVIGFGIVALLAPTLARLLDAPTLARYIPGLAIAAVIRRIGGTPERVLTRSLRFRSVGVASAAGEIAYAIVATSLAAHGWGGDAVIVGNIVQSTVATALLIRAAGWREWATPVPLRWSRFVDMARFGVPLAVQGLAHSASRYWDTLVVARIFGPAAAGMYSLAYNLADIPAIYIGEQLALVLMPSLASLPPARRARAFERATRLLALILFPLAIGLGLVAKPLIALVLPHDWQGVAPVLAALSALSVFRPITWSLSAYMQAREQTGSLMVLEVANLGLLLGGIWALSPLGLVWSASAVGIAFGIYAVAGVCLVSRSGLSLGRVALGFVQPLGACAAMAMGVLAVRTLAEDALPVWSELVVEIAVGAVVYVCVALIVCRDTARDLLALARDMIKQRSAARASYEHA